MKKILFLAGLAVFAVLTWRITLTMSSDALALAVGVVFGVLAGFPTAILVLFSNRDQQQQQQRPQAQQQPTTYNVLVIDSENGSDNEPQQFRIIDGRQTSQRANG